MAKVISDNCLLKAEQITDAFEVGLDEKEVRNLIKATLGRVGQEKKAYQMINSFIVNSYLSGLGTPVANAMSVFLQSIIKPMTYTIGAMTDAIGATKGDRHLGDVLHMLEASLEGFATDMRYFKAGWSSGKPLDIGDSIEALAKAKGTDYKAMRKQIIDLLADKHIEARRAQGDTTPSEMLRESFILAKKTEKEGGLDKMIEEYLGENYDYITNVWPEPIGRIVNVPTKMSVAIDEYGKARLRRMKIAEMASRKARADARAGKGTYPDLYRQYQKMSLDGVNESSIAYRDIQKSFAKLQENLGSLYGKDANDLVPYTDVKEFALDNTFQSRLHGNMEKVSQMRHSEGFTGTLATMFVPFIKTPWNILKEGGTYIPVVPLALRPKYMKGGEVIAMSMDELIPRQILGASLFAGITATFASGYMTGTPRDANEAQKWRDAGIQPQSMLINGEWVSYARLEPLATVFGLIADLNESVNKYQKDPSPDKDLVDYGIFEILNGLKTNILSKTFVEGFATFAEGITQPDKQYQAFTNTMMRPLTPAIMNQVARIMDDHERQATTVGEKMQQRIPFFREQLPMDYSAYNGARKTDKTQAFTGFYTLTEGERTQLQREVETTGASITRPSGRFKSVKLDNEQLALYRGLSSEYAGMYMSKRLASPIYQRATPERRRVLLEDAARTGRQRASREVFKKWMNEDPVFARKFIMEVQQREGKLAEAPLR